MYTKKITAGSLCGVKGKYLILLTAYQDYDEL